MSLWNRARGLRWVHFTHRFLSSVRDKFPWTPLGLLLTVFAAYGLQHFAYDELDLVWLVLGYAVLGLLVLAPVVVIPAAVLVRFGFKTSVWHRSGDAIAPERLVLETGLARRSGFGLPRLPWVPLLQLTWTWKEPSGVDVTLSVEGPQLMEHVAARERGVHSRVVRRVALADAFGLCRIWVRKVSGEPLTVLPSLRGLSRIASFSSFAAGEDLPHPHGLSDGDRLELRRYQPGDPLRFVHWKILARSRQLMVRTPERALSMAQRVVAFLVAGPRDDATAAVARLALERGFLGSDFLFGTAEQSAGVVSVAAGLALTSRSIEHRPHGERGLSHFLATAERGGPTSIILFVPPVPGPWLPATLAACRGKRATVMIGVDGLRSSTRAEGVRRLLFVRHDDVAHDASELAAVVQSFRAAGCSVVVYDRLAGRILNNDQIVYAPQGAAA